MYNVDILKSCTNIGLYFSYTSMVWCCIYMADIKGNLVTNNHQDCICIFIQCLALFMEDIKLLNEFIILIWILSSTCNIRFMDIFSYLK